MSGNGRHVKRAQLEALMTATSQYLNRPTRPLAAALAEMYPCCGICGGTGNYLVRQNVADNGGGVREADVPCLRRKRERCWGSADMTSLCTLLLAATPGEWTAVDFAKAPATETVPALHTMKVRPIQHTALGSLSPEDAAFIAASHNQMAALLDERDALRGALERAEPALWIMATSGNADAVAIHQEVRSILRAALKETPR